MPNQEHLAKLLKDVDAWNRWRADKQILADLDGADLAGERLSKANLHGASLSEANLYMANLSRASLSWANLRGANLIGADLREASLNGANLSEANLLIANLYRADLRRADFSRAILSRANLSGADLREADLSGARLSEADLHQADLGDASLSNADLRRANLIAANLGGAKLKEANLDGARLSLAKLTAADLKGAHLKAASLGGAYLYKAYLYGATLGEADLFGANLSQANLSQANLNGADLSEASLVKACFNDAVLDNCRVYGISAWDVSLKRTSQRDLVITPRGEDAVTVDDLKVAQFIYLLLNNEEVRDIIDTITSKVVLILGRFTEKRRQVLDALRNELRRRDYLPILFDFEKPANRDVTETIITLASMARFVIADISAAKSIAQELSHIIPNLPSVPIQPVLLNSDREFAMFEHWKRFPWVLPDFLYENEEHLLASLTDKVIEPAERKRQEQTKT